jgi:glycosyltransferase involved in cell wall biosynthesis
VKKRNTLIFLTAGFPYGTGETFIENELPFLAEGFQRVIVFTAERYRTDQMRTIRPNVIVQTYPENKRFLWRICTLFDRRFWKAFHQDLIRKNRSCSVLQAFRIAWGVYAKGLLIEKELNRLFNQYPILPAETTLYSYWLDESALAIALTKYKNKSFKAVSRAHGWDVYEERQNTSFLPFRTWLQKNLDLLFSISMNGKNYLIRRFNLPETKIILSPLGTNAISPIHEIRQKKDNLKVISCSSLIPLKRVDLIAEALMKCLIAVEWTHIGAGAGEEELKKITAKRWPGKTPFVGQKNNLEVLDIYDKNYFDVFISLSAHEGLPVSMMEAQSAGIPILATDVGGVNEIVKDGETGWLLPADCTAEQVAKKLEEIRSIPTERMREMRLNCRKHWQNHFSAEKNYRDFIENLRD